MFLQIFSRFLVISCAFGLLACYSLYDLPARETPVLQNVKHHPAQNPGKNVATNKQESDSRQQVKGKKSAALLKKSADTLKNKRAKSKPAKNLTASPVAENPVSEFTNLSPAEAKELQQLIKQNRNFHIGSAFESFQEVDEKKLPKKESCSKVKQRNKCDRIKKEKAQFEKLFKAKIQSHEISQAEQVKQNKAIADAKIKLLNEAAKHFAEPFVLKPITKTSHQSLSSSGITALRDSARDLDLCADRLEREELYEQADALRSQAQKLRLKARR